MSKRKRKEHGFWVLVHQMHLYQSSGEALFKGFGLFITWCGTIFINVINGVPASQDTILFFALSIILEYAVQFVSADNKGTPRQYLTGSLTLLNFFVYAMATMRLIKKITNQDIAAFFYAFQISISLLSVSVILLDAVITACEKEPADKPKKKKLETKLKKV